MAKRVAKTYTNPPLENIVNTAKSGMPDALMWMHTMKDTYSKPSNVSDILASGAKAVIASNALGSAVL